MVSLLMYWGQAEGRKDGAVKKILPYYFMEMLPEMKLRAYAAKPSNF